MEQKPSKLKSVWQTSEKCFNLIKMCLKEKWFTVNELTLIVRKKRDISCSKSMPKQKLRLTIS